MTQPSRRSTGPRRRIPLNVTLDVDTIDALSVIGDGNRSAAIEQLVRDHLAKRRAPAKSSPAQ